MAVEPQYAHKNLADYCHPSTIGPITTVLRLPKCPRFSFLDSICTQLPGRVLKKAISTLAKGQF